MHINMKLIKYIIVLQILRYIEVRQILEPVCKTTPAVNRVIRQPIQDDQEFRCRVKKISLCVSMCVCLQTYVELT
jgi:hypothetical protein